jgi:hypothetical protein
MHSLRNNFSFKRAEGIYCTRWQRHYVAKSEKLAHVELFDPRNTFGRDVGFWAFGDGDAASCPYGRSNSVAILS